MMHHKYKNTIMQPFYLKYSLFNKSFINLAKIILVMKRIVLFVVSFILLSWAASSCEAENCKFCRAEITEDATGDIIDDGYDSEAEYCGFDLITIQSKTPVSVGGYTTSWKCR